jgi:hypothetical protein
LQRELRPIQFCSNFKENLMNLRRVLTAFAVLALFVGLASAQVVVPVPINCSVTAAVPTLRSQGIVERPGDVVITCTGGPTPTAGNPADRATIAISFAGVPITNTTAADGIKISGTSQNSTDALLLIDEPNELGGPAPSYGQNAPISVCTAKMQDTDTGALPAIPAACPAYAWNGAGTNGYWVLDSTGKGGGPTQNAYQGSTPSSSGGNTVLTFEDVPVLSTGSGAVERVYRLVNARLNVGSNASITASVTVTPNTNAITTLNLTNNAVSAGTAASGLTTSVLTVGGATLCASTGLNPAGGVTKANMALLTFTPGFANAFKTQALAIAGATVPTVVANSIAGTPPAQNAANGTYSATYTPPVGSASTITVTSTTSESGVIVPQDTGKTSGIVTYGLAKSGTRLVAKFTGLNANATYYVSAENVIDFNNEAVQPTAIGDADPIPYAVWAGSSAPEVDNTTTNLAFKFTIPGGTSTANPIAPAKGVKVVQLVPSSSGSAEAFWEVTNTQSGAPFIFAFYATYSNVTSPPPVGTQGSVALGFAPTNGSGSSQTQTWIPRFTSIGSATPVFVVVPCQTTLLFPFVTTTKVTATQHWDTGIAIANTGLDPWNSVAVPTTPSTTTYCTLNFYGSGVSSGLNTASQFTPPSVQTPPIGPGQTYAFDLSDPLSAGTAPNVGFAGYMFAVCNFQFAHGFAYIEDGAGDTSGVGNSMGYLALVVDNTGPLQRAAALTGENLSN